MTHSIKNNPIVVSRNVYDDATNSTVMNCTAINMKTFNENVNVMKKVTDRIVRKHWKRAHITTANIENKVSTLYQPGGTAIISTNKISPRITDSGGDPKWMGRWSYITLNGRNKKS